MKKIHDLNIESYSPITPPQIYREDVAISDFSSKVVAESRETVSKIIDGQDKRILLITGPCSIHDVDAGLEYASRLTELS